MFWSKYTPFTLFLIDFLFNIRNIKALEKKASREPYSIVFIGVNGVGKSTNLAKVCYYLQQNGLRVMLAACDTFRSGAVEQLRVHATALDVFLFERGVPSAFFFFFTLIC